MPKQTERGNMGTVRAYRIVLTISLSLNLFFLLTLYFYSTVEGFLSLINMAVGLFD